MKRLISTIFTLVFVITTVFSQITVTSFEELPFDLDASISKKRDWSGKPCAIIKVFTTYKGFSFDNGMLGIVDVEYDEAKHPAEIWVYVPETTMKLKISHAQYGHIQNSQQNDGFYWFQRVKGGKSYKMDLVINAPKPPEPKKQQTGWLLLNSEPEGAEVYLWKEGEKEEWYGVTPFQKKMEYGRYMFRLKKAKYHDEMGMAEVNQPRVQFDVMKLTPAFGSVYVTSNPPGASVTLDGESTGKVTPCTLEEVKSGEHEIRLYKDNYSPITQTVTVSDGQTTPMDISLAARFAQVTVTSLPGASIKINGVSKGIGSFTENLVEGVYDIEVTLASHRSATKQIEVAPGVPQTVEINPTPIYGSLDVMTTPMDATITINGKNYGISPITIENLLIGDYDVVLSKAGCATVTEHVTISENATAAINATLPSGRSVTISSDKAGDEIFVDGVRVGVSPCTTELAFGSHKITAQRGAKRTSKSVSISQGSGAVAVRLGFGLIEPRWAGSVTPSQKAVLERLIANMVRVEGGTFTMGATSEQGGDADSDEKPTHQVTLSAFHIGKYEVTQAEWEAVMGSNPSYYKGSNKPVEQVSWNDCQEFIKKLNRLTGLSFSLPTEAQWEYASRGGNRSKGYKYSGSNKIKDVAWYTGNSGSQTHEVGTKQPNELGLYDMSGNVWEWCSDWYGSYSSGSQTNPTGSTSGSNRVLRGGSWDYRARRCRVSYRYGNYPDDRYFNCGLRLCIVCPE